jgi:DNA-binding NtrC family response regulator
MIPRVLLVEPDSRFRTLLRGVAGDVAQLDSGGSLPEARARLLEKPYDWLITNMRLDAYNGLHLVYLATSAHLPLRMLVYSDYPADVTLAREAQRAGAFFEAQHCLQRTLRAYLEGQLPGEDRRDPGHRDRRMEFRGGRRCADFPKDVAPTV